MALFLKNKNCFYPHKSTKNDPKHHSSYVRPVSGAATLSEHTEKQETSCVCIHMI